MDLSEKSWGMMRGLLDTVVDRRITLSEKWADEKFATKDEMNSRFDRIEGRFDDLIQEVRSSNVRIGALEQKVGLG
jgi:hypothetical protein